MSDLRLDLEFNADTNKAKRQIEDLAKSLRNIANIPASKFDDQGLKDGIKAAKQLQKHLQEAINVNTGKLDLTSFSKSLAKSGQDLNYFQKNLANLGEQGDRAFLKLARSISKAGAPAIKMNEHLREMVQSLKNTARWEISSGILHGLEGSIQHAYNYAKDLDASLNNIRIVTGQNVDQMAKFAVEANKAAKALSTTTTEYTDASLIYYQQGLSDKQVKERTDITVKMANVTGQSAQVVSDQMTSIWNNFDDGSKKLEYYADVLNKLGADTASSTDEIAEGMQKFSAVADTVGLSFEYASSALATITATTRESASVVGTALKSLFSRFQSLKLGDTLEDGTDLRKYSEALAVVGVNIKDHNGQLKDMDTLLTETAAAWQTLGKNEKVALAQTVGGIRQYNQMIALMDNWDFMEQNLQTAYNSTGALDKQAKTFEEGWKASINRVKAAAEGIYDNLIDEDFFIKLNDGFAKFLESVNGLVSGLGGMEGILSTVGGLFLKYFAKEIPDAISETFNTFKHLTGFSKEEVSKSQDEAIERLKKYQFSGSHNQELNAEREGLIKVNQMKEKLAKNSLKLSEAEKAEYQSRIDNVESLYNSYAKASKELDQSQREEESLIDTFLDKHSMSQRQNISDNYDKAKNYTDQINEKELKLQELEGHQKVLDKKDSEIDFQNYTDLYIVDREEEIAERENLQVEREALQLEIDRIKEELVELKQQKIETLQTVGITEDQEELFDWNKGSKDQKETIRKIVNENKDAIKNELETAKKQIKDEHDLQGFSNALKEEADFIIGESNNFVERLKDEDVQKNLFDFFDPMTKGALEQMRNHSPELDKAFKDLQESMKIDNNAEGIQESFRVFYDAFQQVIEKESKEVENTIDETFDNIADKFSNESEEVQETVASELSEVRTSMERTAESEGNVEGARREAEEEGDDNLPDPKLGSSLIELAGSVLELNGAFEGLHEAFLILDDDEASLSEKISAGLGSAVSLVTASMSFADSLKTVGTALVGFNIIQGSSTAGWHLNTVAIKANISAVLANTAALLANPYTWVAIGIGVLIGALAKSTAEFEKQSKAAHEAAVAAQEEINTLKEEGEQAQETASQMTELLEAYKNTGEGKEQLDSVTKQLCEQYHLEGAALAELSGDYEDYQKILQAAQEEKNKILNKEKKEIESAQVKTKESAYYDARKGMGYEDPVDKKYRVSFDTNLDETEAGYSSIIAQNLQDIENVNTITLGNSIDLTFENGARDTEALYQIYLRLLKTKQEMEDLANSRGEDVNTIEGYQSTVQWIDEMAESMGIYGDQKQRVAMIDLAANEKTTLDNVENYDEYIAKSNNIKKELGAIKEPGQDINELFNEFLKMSSNPNLAGFQQMKNILTDIEATGFNVNYTLKRVLNESVRGLGEFDLSIFGDLQWGILDETNWKKAARAAQDYKDAIESVGKAESTREAAQHAVEKVFTKGDPPTAEEYEELEGQFDWGSAESGLIEYLDFLKMSVEEQENYLSQIALQQSVAITQSYQDAIDASYEQILQKQEWMNDNLSDFIGKDFFLEYNVGGTDTFNVDENNPYHEEIIRTIEKESSSILEAADIVNNAWRQFQNTHAMNSEEISQFRESLNTLGFDSNNFMSFLNQSQEELDAFFAANGPLIKAQNFAETTIDLEELKKQVEEAQEAMQIEFELHPEMHVEELKEQESKLINELAPILLKTDLDEKSRAEVEKKLDKLTNTQRLIKIGLETSLAKEIEGVQKDLSKIETQAKKIQKGFKVDPDDILNVVKQFPGILEGAKQLSDGMIQLQEDVAKSAVEDVKLTAQQEAEKTRIKLQAEGDYYARRASIYEQLKAASTELSTKEQTDEGITSKEKMRLAGLVLATAMTNSEIEKTKSGEVKDAKTEDAEKASAANQEGYALDVEMSGKASTAQATNNQLWTNYSIQNAVKRGAANQAAENGEDVPSDLAGPIPDFTTSIDKPGTGSISSAGAGTGSRGHGENSDFSNGERLMDAEDDFEYKYRFSAADALKEAGFNPEDFDLDAQDETFIKNLHEAMKFIEAGDITGLNGYVESTYGQSNDAEKAELYYAAAMATGGNIDQFGIGMDNVASGQGFDGSNGKGNKGGGGKKGSGDKDKNKGDKGGKDDQKEITPKDFKSLDDELERYHYLTNLLEELNRQYERLNKEREQFFGKDKIAYMNKEGKALEKLVEAQKDYISEIEKNLKVDKTALSRYGFSFDEDGNIKNYDSVVRGQVNSYNSKVSSYNSGGISEEAFEHIDKDFENFKKLTSQYEESNKLLKEANDELFDLTTAIKDLNYEKFQYKVELKHQLDDNEFKELDYYFKQTEGKVFKAVEGLQLLIGETVDVKDKDAADWKEASSIVDQRREKDFRRQRDEDTYIRQQGTAEEQFQRQRLESLDTYVNEMLIPTPDQLSASNKWNGMMGDAIISMVNNDILNHYRKNLGVPIPEEPKAQEQFIKDNPEIAKQMASDLVYVIPKAFEKYGNDNDISMEALIATTSGYQIKEKNEKDQALKESNKKAIDLYGSPGKLFSEDQIQSDSFQAFFNPKDVTSAISGFIYQKLTTPEITETNTAPITVENFPLKDVLNIPEEIDISDLFSEINSGGVTSEETFSLPDYVYKMTNEEFEKWKSENAENYQLYLNDKTETYDNFDDDDKESNEFREFLNLERTFKNEDGSINKNGADEVEENRDKEIQAELDKRPEWQKTPEINDQKLDVDTGKLGILLEKQQEFEWRYDQIIKDDSLTQAQKAEELQRLYDEAYENVEAINELQEQVKNYYGETLQLALAEIQKFTDSMDHLNGVLDHFSNIMGLLGKQNDYKMNNLILKGQQEIAEDKLDISTTKYEDIKKMREDSKIDYEEANWNYTLEKDILQNAKDRFAMGEITEEELKAAQTEFNSVENNYENMKKIYEDNNAAFQQSEEEMLADAEHYGEIIKAKLINSMEEAKQGMEMALSGGLGFDSLSESMKNLSSYQSEYLTKTNQIYETNKILNDLNKDIEKTDNDIAKEKYQAFSEEIKQLQEKEKLSNLELEIAKGKYKVLEAQIALEEVKNSKDAMRLVRDDSGNYDYVFTADQEKIDEAEQTLADAENDLYNVQLDAANNYGEKTIQAKMDLANTLAEMDARAAEDAVYREGTYQAERAAVIEEYTNLITSYSELYGIATSEDARVAQDAWIGTYDHLIKDGEKWKDSIEEYSGQVTSSLNTWQKESERLLGFVGKDFDETSQKVRNLTTDSNDLKEKVIKEVIPALKDELQAVGNLANHYAWLSTSITDAKNAQLQFAQGIRGTISNMIGNPLEDEEEYKPPEVVQNQYGKIEPSIYNIYTAPIGKELFDQPAHLMMVGVYAGNVEAQQNGLDKIPGPENGGQYWVQQGAWRVPEIIENQNSMSIFKGFTDSLFTFLGFDTGGYTGEWGPDGKLAFLHQKEIVLNADDTKNFLSGISILRSLDNILETNASLMKNMVFDKIPEINIQAIEPEPVQQDVTIHAEFPNVSNSDEIEMALENLINETTQYIYTRDRQI